jgi:hypothetical protein
MEPSYKVWRRFADICVYTLGQPTTLFIRFYISNGLCHICCEEKFGT